MGEMPDIFQSTLNPDLKDLKGSEEGMKPVLHGLIAHARVREMVLRARTAIKDRENDLDPDDSINKLCEMIEYLSLGLKMYYNNQVAIVPMNLDPRTAEAMAACLDEKIRELKVKWGYLSGGLGMQHNLFTMRRKP